MKKKKLSSSQKKITKVMHEFNEGELHAGKTETIVKNRKQAIAIALSEADEVEKLKNE
jgi:ribosomal protein L21E